MDDLSEQRELVEVLADEFIRRRRAGESPRMEEYTSRYPHLADEIRELFPISMMLDEAAPVAEPDYHLGAVVPERPLHDVLGFGDYRILREIGQGGMGIVYEAEQISLHRRVALKILRRHLHGDQLQQQRFEREAQAAARLHHHHIVPVFGVGSVDDQLYYVMQFIPGKGLDRVLEGLRRARDQGDPLHEGWARVTGELVENDDAPANHSPPPDQAPADSAALAMGGMAPFATLMSSHFDPTEAIDAASTISGVATAETFTTIEATPLGSPHQESRSYWSSVARLGLQVATALEYAHSHNILHRDIKPSNLILDPWGSVWITDFGLAKTDDDQALTQTGDIVGTLRYLAPEAFNGVADQRSDIYALGLTIYELLALRPAFDESDRQHLVAQITRGVPLLSRLNPRVPADLVAVVHKATDLEPPRRYATAGDLAADLQRFLNDEPVKARRVTSLERLSRWARHNQSLALSLAALTLLLFSAVVGSSWAAFHMREQSLAALNAQNGAEQKANESRVNLYYSHMQLARQAAETHRGAGRLHEILAYWLPEPRMDDLRGWEWYFLNSLTHRQLDNWRTLQRPLSVDWSPDGSKMASADEDGRVRVWTADGRLLLELGKHRDGATAVAWSKDQSLLASTGADRTVRIWSPITGELVRIIEQEDIVSCLSWSVDGQHLACGDASGRVLAWSLPDSRQKPATSRQMPQRHQGGVRAIAWRPGSARQFVSAGADGVVRLWDEPHAKIVNRWQAHLQPVLDLDWSSSGDQLVTASADRSVKIWNLEQLDQPRQLDGHTHEVLCVRWTRDDQLVVSTGRDDTIRVWDAATGQLRNVWRGHTATIRSLAIHPQRDEVASAGDDFTIRHWSLTGGSHYLAMPDDDDMNDSFPSCLAWSRDGRTAAFKRGKFEVLLWDRQLDSIWRRIQDMPSEVVCMDWSRQERRDQLAIGAADGSVHLWNEQAGVYLTSRLASAPVLAVVWNPDGRYLAASDATGEVHLWDTQTGQHQAMRHLARGETQTRALRWSHDGAWLAAGSSNGLLRLWPAGDVGPPQVVQAVHDGEVTCLAWSPDDRQLATGGADRLVKIWQRTANATELRQARVLRGHNDHLQSLDWSPDGRRLATASVDTTIRIWDPENGKESLALFEHMASVDCVRWNPDGLQLASSSHDGSVRRWNATAGFRAAMSPLMLPALDSRLALAPQDATARRLRAEIQAAAFSWDRAAADFDQLARQFGDQGQQGAFFPTINWLSAPAAAGEGSAIHRDSTKDGEPRLAVIPLPVDGLPNLPDQFERADPTIARITTRVYCSSQKYVALSPMYAKLRSLLVNDQPIDLTAPSAQAGEPPPIVLLQGWNVLEADVAIAQDAPIAPLRLSDDPGLIVRGLEVRQRWRDALIFLEEAIRRAPENADLHRRLAETHLNLARVLALSQDAAQQRQARVQLDRAVEVLEGQRVRTPEDSHLVDLLADVALQRELAMAPLSSLTAEATHGTQLSLQPDLSWLAEGPAPPLESYVLRATLDAPLHGLFLEALADDSLPVGGPGRQGNFHLTGVRVNANQTKVELSGAHASFRRPIDDVTSEEDGPQAVLDNDRSTRWDIWPQLGSDHWLALTFAEPVPAGANLEVVLEFLDPRFTNQTLGRFRIHASSAARLEALCWWRWTAVDMRSPWTRLAAARWLGNDPEGALRALREESQSPDDCYLRAWALMSTQRGDLAKQWLDRAEQPPKSLHAGLTALWQDIQRLESP